MTFTNPSDAETRICVTQCVEGHRGSLNLMGPMSHTYVVEWLRRSHVLSG